MGSFTVNSSLFFGLAELVFLILKTRILIISSEVTPDKNCLLLHFTYH